MTISAENIDDPHTYDHEQCRRSSPIYITKREHPNQINFESGKEKICTQYTPMSSQTLRKFLKYQIADTAEEDFLRVVTLCWLSRCIVQDM